MNKISKLLMAFAVVGLASCSNDEPTPDQGGNSLAKGDTAYLNVNILSGDAAASKAGSQVDGKDFVYGTGDENTVDNAYFFFYDAEGKFVLQSNSWTGQENGSDENVEIIGKNTVILKGLTGKNYPSWVVTVLNKPSDIVDPVQGEDISKLLERTTNCTYAKGSENRFVMTTSSYFEDSPAKDWQYYATPLNDGDFHEEPGTDTDSNVEIFVERLAARVEVVTNLTAAKTIGEGAAARNLYLLEVSIAGDPNADEDKDDVAAEKVYVEFLGWNLNATAKTSYLIKNLEGWSATTPENLKGDWTYTNAWNHAAYHRSYWGKSTTYGKAGNDLAALLNVGDQYFTDLNGTVGTERLNSPAMYINECTNEIDNITDGNKPLPHRTTTALIGARVCDANGNGLDIVSYLGINYLKPAFIKKAFQIVNPEFYTREFIKTVEGKDLYKYTQIVPKYASLASAGGETGAAKVVVNATYTDAEGNVQTTPAIYTLGAKETVIEKDGEGNEIARYDYYPNATAINLSAADNALNTALLAATSGDGNTAIAYTSGAMVYPVPLEHLREPDTADSDALEGQWGIVRNHLYTLNIKKINALGNGVFDPRSEEEGGEPIKPEDPKDPTYYVQSKINILSWKIVSQNVEL